MITEAQRRALSFLREALRLCDDAKIIIHGHAKRIRVASDGEGEDRFGILTRRAWLSPTDIETLLREHSEPQP